jgi:DNA helicase IV
MAAHPDVPAEQAYLDGAYACLAAMRARTEAAVAVADNAAQEVDSEIARAHLAHRLRTLDVEVPGLSFGRLDSEHGDTWYVGRRHVEDDRGEPVVVDWRAPVATPFYRATAADPLDLRRRRRFLMSGARLEDLFDEVFGDEESMIAAHHGGIPDPLLAELERARTGEMADIVATIAAEQDVVIRSELDTCLVVQGGPGTGKTAVGLHRAAFLLYEHREHLDREGVLVIGPNPVFLRYIAQVLPSLGETAARQTTLERLVCGTRLQVRAVDTPDRARLLGDARLAEVLPRALRATLRPPREDVVVGSGWDRVVLPAAEVAADVEEIAGRGVAFTTGRTALRARLERLAGRPGSDLSAAVARMWPTTSGPALAKRVLTNRTALARAAEGLLDAGEQRLLLRRGARRLDDEPWTSAELVLVDEAEALVNGVARTYGHLVVDEAQDLSAMELRALARRCPSRSMTVLGDLAQATAPAAQRSWPDALSSLGDPMTAAVEELAVGYRVPQPIIAVANRLLPHVAPGVRPAGSVRLQGRAPEAVPSPPGALAETVAAVVAELAGRWRSVGVIVPEGIPVAAPGGRHDERVTVVAPPEAKGLEFDAVVVVEPAAFWADGDVAGGRLLYIALTRAVQELWLVHERPLPASLLDSS